MIKHVWGTRVNINGFILVLFCFIGLFNWNRTYAEDTDWNQINSADWMEHVSDSKKISEITIPGSHNSTTQYIPFAYFTQCQEDSIAGQLENGVRYLDIRLKSVEKEDEVKLELSHGFISCRISASFFSKHLTFKNVLQQCYDFLDNHPKETIIMAVKHEYGQEDDQQMQNAIYKLIEHKKDIYWYLKNENPKLEEIRGKIVLARRYEDENNYGEEDGGLNFQWREQSGTDLANSPYEENEIVNGFSLLVQDRYEYGEEDKWEAIRYGLEQSESSPESEDGFFLNYLSTKGDTIFGHPKKYADAINKKLLEYELKSDCNYGILVMDFITEELARKVYESNQFVIE